MSKKPKKPSAAKSQKTSADKKVNDLFKLANRDSTIIHSRIGKHLTKLDSQDASNALGTRKGISGANAALSGLLAANTRNAVQTVDAEQARLGISGVGSAGTASEGGYASRMGAMQGSDALGTHDMARNQSIALNPLYRALNQGQLKSALSEQKITRTEGLSANAGAYKQALAYEKSFKPYSGGSSFTPYGRSNFVPYGRGYSNAAPAAQPARPNYNPAKVALQGGKIVDSILDLFPFRERRTPKKGVGSAPQYGGGQRIN